MHSGKLFGLIILVVGVLYLLNLFGLFHLSAVWFSWGVIWPLLIVLWGLNGLGSLRRGRIPYGSLFLIVYGVLMVLRNVGYPSVPATIGDWDLFCALGLIFMGLHFITPRRRRHATSPVIVISRNSKKWKVKSSETQGKVVDIETDEPDTGAKTGGKTQPKSDWRLIGDVSVGGQPWVLKDMDMWNGIGDVRLNLATAHVEDGDYEINIGGWIGDIRVLVPEDIAVCVDARVGIGDLKVFGDMNSGGGRTIHTEDPSYIASTRRCHINVDLKIGDVQIVRV